MGKDLYENYEQAKQIYDKSSEILGLDIPKLSFESNIEVLSETKNTQIAILVMSLAISKILKESNINADVCAGLSLGEYSALMYANAISFEDGIKIVRKRGRLMQENVPEGNWSMATIIGLEDDKVKEACQMATKGFVVPANYNCPGQVAVSGEKEAVLEVMEISKELGAKKAIELKTSGPFHTIKLKEASDKLKKELESLQINLNSEVEVVKNIDGSLYSKNDDIKDILSKHVISSVQFSKSIQTMINMGVDTFVEIGPGKVLSGFVKKVDKNVKVFNIQNVETLTKTISLLKNEEAVY